MKIIYTNSEGRVTVLTPFGRDADEVLANDIPSGVSDAEIVPSSNIPSDITFRDAWEKVGSNIYNNIGKCKDIAHNRRREKRSEEFAPLDIKATIPSEAVSAEVEREVIRNKYATLQINIDDAISVDELKTLLNNADISN